MNKRVLAAIVAVVVVIVAIVVGVTIYIISQNDDSQHANGPVEYSTVISADGVVVPKIGAKLSLRRGGVVGQILVEENSVVESGQIIASLENQRETASLTAAEVAYAKAIATYSKLQAAIATEKRTESESRPILLAQANNQLEGAEEKLLHVSGEYEKNQTLITPGGNVLEGARLKALAEAEQQLEQAEEDYLLALGVASLDDGEFNIPETSDTISNLANHELKVNEARLAVERAEQEVAHAESVKEVLEDAQNEYNAAKNNFERAESNYLSAQSVAAELVRKRQQTLDDVKDDLVDAYLSWFGVELSDEELMQTPTSLYAEWGIDLDKSFNRLTGGFDRGKTEDDPATKWNENIIYGWLYLHPSAGSIRGTSSNNFETAGFFTTCVEKDVETDYEAYRTAKDSLESAQASGDSNIAYTENLLVKATDALEDAKDEFALFDSGKSDLPLNEARANVTAAKAELNDLTNKPDPVDIGKAKGALKDATGELNDLLDWPDPVEIALAQGHLDKVKQEVERLEAGVDPLVEARWEAQMAEATALVAIASSKLAVAKVTLSDTQLIAPFGGTLTSLSLEIGESVPPNKAIGSLADTNSWAIETEDLDELNVVGIAEGDIVDVTFDAIPGLSLEGSVSNISSYGLPRHGAITYQADIDMPDSDPRLRWNMTATVTLRE